MRSIQKIRLLSYITLSCIAFNKIGTASGIKIASASVFDNWPGGRQHISFPDNPPDMSQQWQEVSIAYNQDFPYLKAYENKKIPGCFKLKSAKPVLRCREQIQLLRPRKVIDRWKSLQERRGYLSIATGKTGNTVLHAHISHIQSSEFNGRMPCSSDGISNVVISRFIRHTTHVAEYKFKNEQGRINKITATPDHLFYVINKKTFMPVDDLSSADLLINDTGQTARLICPSGHFRHCGSLLYQKQRIVTVYNLEVRGQPVYFVGKQRILVHNGCNNHLKKFYEQLKGHGLISEKNETVIISVADDQIHKIRYDGSAKKGKWQLHELGFRKMKRQGLYREDNRLKTLRVWKLPIPATLKFYEENILSYMFNDEWILFKQAYNMSGFSADAPAAISDAPMNAAESAAEKSAERDLMRLPRLRFLPPAEEDGELLR